MSLEHFRTLHQIAKKKGWKEAWDYDVHITNHAFSPSMNNYCMAELIKQNALEEEPVLLVNMPIITENFVNIHNREPMGALRAARIGLYTPIEALSMAEEYSTLLNGINTELDRFMQWFENSGNTWDAPEQSE